MAVTDEKDLEVIHYVPPRKKRARPGTKMQPPLTPMIDVTFQLLLFFLLTLTFREAEGLIPATLPRGETSPAAQIDPDVITIRVSPAPGNPIGGVFEMRGESRQIERAEQLYQILEGLKQSLGSDRIPVIIEADAEVLWEHVVNAFNQAVRAKYRKIGFAMVAGGWRE